LVSKNELLEKEHSRHIYKFKILLKLRRIMDVEEKKNREKILKRI